MSLPSQTELEQALRDAGATHHEYETVYLNGAFDAQWPGFYAAFVLGRLGDFALPTRVTRLLEDAPDSADWAAGAARYVLAQLAG